MTITPITIMKLLSTLETIIQIKGIIRFILMEDLYITLVETYRFNNFGGKLIY